jgi:hypothetical protein
LARFFSSYQKKLVFGYFNKDLEKVHKTTEIDGMSHSLLVLENADTASATTGAIITLTMAILL